MSDSNIVKLEDNLNSGAVSRYRMGAMTHLLPRGDLSDDEQLEALKAAATECLENQEIQLVIDLVSVSLIDSKALENLYDLRQDLAKVGGWLKLTNAKPLIVDILRVTAMDQFIEIVNSLEVKKSQPARAPALAESQIGRASCRERV